MTPGVDFNPVLSFFLILMAFSFIFNHGYSEDLCCLVKIMYLTNVKKLCKIVLLEKN